MGDEAPGVVDDDAPMEVEAEEYYYGRWPHLVERAWSETRCLMALI